MKKKNLVLLLSGIVVILVGVVISLFIKKGVPVNANGKTVKELYSYVGNSDLEKCGGLVFYNDSKVDYNSLSNDTKICLAYTQVKKEVKEEIKLDKNKKGNICTLSKGLIFATDNYEDKICTLSKTNKDLVNENYKKIFGKEIDAYDKFQLDNITVCYLNDDSYYCGLSEEYTYTIGAEPHTYRAIKDSFKKNNEIIIYDYFLKVINNECYTSYVKDSKNDKCTKALENNKNVEYKFLKKYGTQYKHIFKKDNNVYHWVSSEKIN